MLTNTAFRQQFRTSVSSLQFLVSVESKKPYKQGNEDANGNKIVIALTPIMESHWEQTVEIPSFLWKNRFGKRVVINPSFTEILLDSLRPNGFTT